MGARAPAGALCRNWTSVSPFSALTSAHLSSPHLTGAQVGPFDVRRLGGPAADLPLVEGPAAPRTRGLPKIVACAARGGAASAQHLSSLPTPRTLVSPRAVHSRAAAHRCAPSEQRGWPRPARRDESVRRPAVGRVLQHEHLPRSFRTRAHISPQRARFPSGRAGTLIIGTLIIWQARRTCSTGCRTAPSRTPAPTR